MAKKDSVIVRIVYNFKSRCQTTQRIGYQSGIKITFVGWTYDTHWFLSGLNYVIVFAYVLSGLTVFI